MVNTHGRFTIPKTVTIMDILYSFDPYYVQDNRKTDVPEYTTGQNEYNYSFQNYHYSLLLLVLS